MEGIKLDGAREKKILELALIYIGNLSLIEDLEMAEIEKMDIDTFESMSNQEVNSYFRGVKSISDLYAEQEKIFYKMLELEVQSEAGKEFIFNDIVGGSYSKVEVAEMFIDFYSCF